MRVRGTFGVTVGALALLLSMLAAACGGAECPECNCPVCPPPPVVHHEPVGVVVGECTEEWVHMPVLINFPTGGAEIDAQNRTILQEVVRTAQVRQDIRRVRVEGHTDTCGSEVGNMALSQTRAEAISIALVQLGVPREMIETVGFGSTQPRANEDCAVRRTEELSRQTNRRVEFSILVCREGTAGSM